MDSGFAHDWQMWQKRFEAWWQNETLDRPVVILRCRREKPRWPLRNTVLEAGADPSRLYLDPELRIDRVEDMLATTDFFGDAVPTAGRGINTGYLASFARGKLRYDRNRGGVWIDPCVSDWSTAPVPTFDPMEATAVRRLGCGFGKAVVC